MKTLFICGTLEEGKDGVGDYTRRLAGELIRQGHPAFIMAYNDKHTNTIINDVQQDEGTAINTLRLPAVLKSKKKVRLAGEYIQKFQPDWISLQFVIYSFHAKGLPFFLTKQLKQIGKGYKWHIMFHELWIGMDREAPLKHKIIGKIQQQIIKRLLNILKPKKTHSQTPIYIHFLNKNIANNTCKKLPLFSNVRKYNGSIQIEELNTNYIHLIVFGSIQAGSPLTNFIADLKEYEKIIGKNIQFIFIGRNGSRLATWVRELEKSSIRYLILGECSERKISSVLQRGSWGISTTPIYQIEKSGSAAGMLEHGLPVYVVARNWSPTDNITMALPNYIRVYKKGRLNLKREWRGILPSNSLQQVALQFLEDINA